MPALSQSLAKVGVKLIQSSPPNNTVDQVSADPAPVDPGGGKWDVRPQLIWRMSDDDGGYNHRNHQLAPLRH